ENQQEFFFIIIIIGHLLLGIGPTLFSPIYSPPSTPLYSLTPIPLLFSSERRKDPLEYHPTLAYHLCMAGGLPLRALCFLSEIPLKKIKFSLASGYQLEIGMWACDLLSALRPHLDLSSRSSYSRISRGPPPNNQMGGRERRVSCTNKDTGNCSEVVSRPQCIEKGPRFKCTSKRGSTDTYQWEG
ncbi:mCG1031053, partial [Mus musculus]